MLKIFLSFIVCFVLLFGFMGQGKVSYARKLDAIAGAPGVAIATQTNVSKRVRDSMASSRVTFEYDVAAVSYELTTDWLSGKSLKELDNKPHAAHPSIPEHSMPAHCASC